MKNIFYTNNLLRKQYYVFALLFMTACILGQSIAENPIITERCFSPFAPDTISPDSIAAITDTTSIDTIAVIEIYTPEIIDTTYSDGLLPPS